MTNHAVEKRYFHYTAMTFYDSFGMVRVHNRLFKIPIVAKADWENAKQTLVFRLDKVLRVWDFYLLYYDGKSFPLPLTRNLVLRSWLHYGGTCLMFLGRVQRWWRRMLRAVRERKMLGFAMAFHGRLGEGAGVAVVGPDLLEKIGMMALKA
jgi:hypothetical protein